MRSPQNQPSRKLIPESRILELKRLINQDYRNLKNIPESEQSDELIKLAIEKNWRALKHVISPSEEHIRLAVGIDGMALQYLNKSQQNEQLCINAIRRGTATESQVFNHVKIKTPTILLEAVKKSCRALDKIKEHTEELYLAAVKADPLAPTYFTKQLSAHFYERCVEANGRCLKCFKEDILTYDLALYAVKKDWKLLNLIVEIPNYLTEELCMAAYHQDVRALQFLWPELSFNILSCSKSVTEVRGDLVDINIGKYSIDRYESADKYIQLQALDRERDIAYSLETARRTLGESSVIHKPTKKMDVI